MMEPDVGRLATERTAEVIVHAGRRDDGRAGLRFVHEEARRMGASFWIYAQLLRAEGATLRELRERAYVAAPITYSAYRFARSLYGNKGYSS